MMTKKTKMKREKKKRMKKREKRVKMINDFYIDDFINSLFNN